jgi:hypothetical protein
MGAPAVIHEIISRLIHMLGGYGRTIIASQYIFNDFFG